MKKVNDSIDALTGLKAICCLMIVALHTYKPTAENMQGIVNIIQTYFADFGNAMFFIMSGFLMAIFYRNKIQNRKIIFPDFIFKKLVKLYPLYAITNIFCLVVAIGDNGISEFDLNRLLTTLFMMNGGTLESYFLHNYPSWFACVTILCYCIYYFIAHHSYKNDTRYICGIIVMIVVGYILLGHDYRFPFCYAISGKGYLNFFIGCLMAEVYNISKDKNRINIIVNVLVCFLIFLNVIDSRGFSAFCGNFASVVSFCFGPLILLISLNNRIANRILRLKPLHMLGKLSISMFYWHAGISWLFKYTIKDAIVSKFTFNGYYALYFVILIGVCIISQQLIEIKLAKMLLGIKGEKA